MQHISTISNIKTERKVVTERPRLLSLYTEPPQQELTLDEFEVVSLDRLQLLRSIEVLKTKGAVEGEQAFNNQVYEVSFTTKILSKINGQLISALIYHTVVGEEVPSQQPRVLSPNDRG